MVRESFTSGDGLRRLPGHAFADELVVGMRVIPPGRKRPVTIEYQLTDPGSKAGYFEFACSSRKAGLRSYCTAPPKSSSCLRTPDPSNPDPQPFTEADQPSPRATVHSGIRWFVQDSRPNMSTF